MQRAKANLPLSDGYRSDAERSWAASGNHYLLSHYGVTVVKTYYEPFTVNLPGGRYTPDFMHILGNGQIVFVEIKGSKAQKGYRDARSKLRAAAELHPWADWIEAVGSSRFEIERIE